MFICDMFLLAQMPPFGAEPEEKQSRPLSFLSSRHAPKPSKKPLRAFGLEPAEQCETGTARPPNPSPVVNSRSLPFQDEPEESQPVSQLKKQRRDQGPGVAHVLFGEEPDEDESSSSSAVDLPQTDTVFPWGGIPSPPSPSPHSGRRTWMTRIVSS